MITTMIKFLLLAMIIPLFCFLLSCASISPNSEVNTKQNLNYEIESADLSEESTTPAFVYDTDKYPLSQGQDSPDGMKAAIKLNGKYYEGDEYYYGWVSYGSEMYAGNDYCSHLMDNSYYPHSIKEIPEGCPIIKLSQNDQYEFVSEYLIRMHYFVDFYGYSKNVNTYEDIPDQPGIYLLVAVTADIQGIPWFSENFVKPETYTEYALSYQYIFAVIVE